MVKNCDRGHARGHSFSALHGPTLSRQITCLFFSCSKLVLQITNGFAYATLSLNRLARRLLTICKRVSQILENERCVKEQTFFDLVYVSCIYFTS